MKHIEHATADELLSVANCNVIIAVSKDEIRHAGAHKRAIAERCRQRARVLRAKQGEKP